MPEEFSANDRGKRVLTADGEMVGTIEDVAGDRAHVKPDAGLERSIRRKLGWSGERDTYELKRSNVSKISDTEVHLQSM